jgi:hypothetical protein
MLHVSNVEQLLVAERFRRRGSLHPNWMDLVVDHEEVCVYEDVLRKEATHHLFRTPEPHHAIHAFFRIKLPVLF